MISRPWTGSATAFSCPRSPFRVMLSWSDVVSPVFRVTIHMASNLASCCLLSHDYYLFPAFFPSFLSVFTAVSLGTHSGIYTYLSCSNCVLTLHMLYYEELSVLRPYFHNEAQ